MSITVFKSVVSKVRTPDGTMFVNVLENAQGEPIQVIVNIGKAGTSPAAWAQAVATLCTAMLEGGMKLEAILTRLSSITSSGAARSTESVVTSGPEGVYIALLRYRKAKFEELKEQLGQTDEDEEEESRNARATRR